MLWFVISIPLLGVLIATILVLVVEKDVSGFFLCIIGTLFFSYIFLRPLLWRVSFIGNKVLAAKTSAQREKLDVSCDKILKCDMKWHDTVHFSLLFNCSDKKLRGLSVTLFSKKQVRKILEMIKERGGLKEQENIDEIVEKFLKFDSGKKTKKRKTSSKL